MNTGKYLSGKYRYMWQSLSRLEQRDFHRIFEGLNEIEMATKFVDFVDITLQSFEFIIAPSKKRNIMTKQEIQDFFEQQVREADNNGGIAITPISSSDALAIFEEWQTFDDTLCEFKFD